jgi:signal transduction protein with GAF and PtsI domain
MALAGEIARSASDQEALARVVKNFAADSGTVHLIGSDGLLHLAAATEGLPAQVLAVIGTIPIGKGMAGLAVERRAPVDACNIQTDASGDVRPGARATGLAGALVVPIFRGDDVIGALGIANRAERRFTESEIADLMVAGRALAARHPEVSVASGK